MRYLSFHFQYGKWIALTVTFMTFEHFESHSLIKSYGIWILFVDINALYV